MIEAVIGAVAEAVFSYILGEMSLAEKIRRRLGRDPVKLAYRKALTRAYTAFVRQYPDVAAALFNESFLANEALPFLVKQITTRLGKPDPALLAKAWASSISPLPVSNETMETATLGSAYFLERLEDELRIETVFQDLFNSKALDSIESHLARLSADLVKATTAATTYQEVVTNNYYSSDNRINNIYNTYYSGHFSQLKDLYVPPDDVFQRVRVQEFVGREWLTEKVDEFLAQNKSGVFILDGEAGVGKTSFLAHLVYTRRYLHLFAEQVPGETNVTRALQSLGSQIVTRYHLTEYVKRDALPEIATFPDFLSKLLRLAASNLVAGEQIVIVCDAIDEAGIATNGNAFGLPQVLPTGVFFILSQRPVPDRCHFSEITPRHVRLDPNSSENKADVTEYLSNAAKWPEVAKQLRFGGYSTIQFIETLGQKSGGIWMYLFYILSEIRNGTRAPLDLKTLPNGLLGYYTQFWNKWRNEDLDKWDLFYAPLLATFATARDFISADWLMAWSGIQESKYKVIRLVEENWQAFIKQDNQKRYALYHASLRDFLTIGAQRSIGISTLHDEMIGRIRDAHHHIIEYFRTICKGDWVKLIEDDYARRYLCAHLVDAGLHAELFTLVAENGAWAQARQEKDENYDDYLKDLELAWRWSENQRAFHLGKQIRCALIESTIHSLAGNVSPELLAYLVSQKVWSPARGLSNIPQMPSEWHRAQAIANIAPLLPEALKLEALNIAVAITNEFNRALALRKLAPFLSESLRQDAMQTANAIQSDYNSNFDSLLESRTRDFAPDNLIDTLKDASAINDDYNHASFICGVIPYLPEPLLSDAIANAIHVISITKNEFSRARSLERLAPHAFSSANPNIGDEVLQVIVNIQNESYRADAIIYFAPHLPANIKLDYINVALNIQNEFNRVRTIVSLTPHLSKTLRNQILTNVLQAARGIQDEYDRSRALAALMPFLPRLLKFKALQLIGEIKNESDRANTFSAIAPYLTKSLQFQALELILKIQNESLRVRALGSIAPHLAKSTRQKALQIAYAIKDEFNRVCAICNLASVLPRTQRSSIIADIFEIAHTIQNESNRAHAVSNLIPHLPRSLINDAIDDALQATRVIQNDTTRVYILANLLPHIPETQKNRVITEAIQVVNAIQNETHRILALGNIAPYLTEDTQADALQTANAIRDESVKADALGKLIPHLNASAQREVIKIIKSTRNEFCRASALCNIIPNLDNALKDDALHIAKSISNESDRAKALSHLVPHLRSDIVDQVIVELFPLIHKLADISFSTNNALEGRADIYNRVIQLWKESRFNGFQVQLLWPETLHDLADRPRSELLDDLTALLPLIEHLGGQEAVVETYKAVRDVTQWWP